MSWRHYRARLIPRFFRVSLTGGSGGGPLKHLSARVLSRVRHFLSFFLCFSLSQSPSSLLFFSQGCRSTYIPIYTYTYIYGHQSCDYLPSPLIGTIYVRGGSRVSRLRSAVDSSSPVEISADSPGGSASPLRRIFGERSRPPVARLQPFFTRG